MDYIKEKEPQILAAIKECGDIILNAKRTEEMIDEKAGHANFVTTYDKLVQETIKARLKEIMPEAAFVGEEDDVHASIEKGYAFIVDPIDGTTNFIKDYKVSVISVGLTNDGQLVFGAVYNPYRDEMYSAIKGNGAFLNGKQIHASKKPLEEGLVLFGTAPYYKELVEESFEIAKKYFYHAMDLRRSGSAAQDLCSIAAGRAEFFFELKLMPWDYAAGAMILMEAGGVISQMDGSEITLDKPCSIKASNKTVAGQEIL